MLSLYEITRAELEGVSRTSDYDILKSLVNKYKNDPGVFVSYQDPEQMVLGINPKVGYNTPLGVYGYPLYNASIQQDILNDELPYAKERPWIYFFRFKDVNRVWNLLKDDPQDTIEKLKRIFPEDRVDEVVYNKSDEIGAEKVNSKVAFFATHELAGRGKPVAWTKLLLRLGYHGVVDYGQEIIYETEPTQGFALSSKFIEIIEQVQNPFPVSHSPYAPQEFVDKLWDLHDTKGLSRVHEVVIQFLMSPKRDLATKQKYLARMASAMVTWEFIWKVLEIDPRLIENFDLNWLQPVQNLANDFAKSPEETINKVVEVVENLMRQNPVLSGRVSVSFRDFLIDRITRNPEEQFAALKQLYSHEATKDLAELVMARLWELSLPVSYNHLAKQLEDLGLISGDGVER